MKGIAENELGLKGISTSDDSELKGIGEPKVSVLGLKGVGDPAPPRRGATEITDQISQFLDRPDHAGITGNPGSAALVPQRCFPFVEKSPARRRFQRNPA